MTFPLIYSLDYIPKTEEEDIVFTLAMVIIEIFMLRSQDFSANIIMISILGKGYSEDEQRQHDTCCRRGGYRYRSLFVFCWIDEVLCVYFVG